MKIGEVRVVLKLKDGVLSEVTSEATVLLDTVNEKVVVLPPEEQELLQGFLSLSFEEVVGKMKDLYDGDERKMEEDIKLFYNKLIDNGFAEEQGEIV